MINSSRLVKYLIPTLNSKYIFLPDRCRLYALTGKNKGGSKHERESERVRNKRMKKGNFFIVQPSITFSAQSSDYIVLYPSTNSNNKKPLTNNIIPYRVCIYTSIDICKHIQKRWTTVGNVTKISTFDFDYFD